MVISVYPWFSLVDVGLLLLINLWPLKPKLTLPPMCMWYIYMSVCVCTGGLACACTCGGQRLASGIFLSIFLRFFILLYVHVLLSVRMCTTHMSSLKEIV